MKRIILIFLAFSFFQTSWGQVPTKMSYQAVVRDASNNLVANQNVGIKISVLQGSPSGSAVYEETHTANSNVNGLVSLVINEGQPVSGNFATINWTNNTYFIKNEIDINGGTNYTITGVQQIFSVPYAIHAKTADNFTFENAELGEMLYFNGSDWVSIPAGVEGQALSFCDGKPTWGVCIKTIRGGIPTATTAKVNGRINSDATITEKGICYSTTPNPTISDLTSISNVSSLAWTTTLVNLTINTIYYARAYVINTSGIQYGNEITFTTANSIGVGDYYPEEGGIVFYLLQPGDPGYDTNTPHGLILSLTSPNSSPWGCSDTEIGTSTDISTGSNNTNLIINNCDDYPIAAKICDEYTYLSFDDWYLPSKDELYQIGVNRLLINATLNADSDYNSIYTNLHWSSSETDDSTKAYSYNFAANIFQEKLKIQTVRIRPIRSF